MYKKIINAYKNYRVAVIGKALVLDNNKKKNYKYKIDVESEIKNLKKAINEVKKEINYLEKYKNKEVLSIFNFYKLFLEEYEDNLTSLIQKEKINVSFIIERELKKDKEIFDKIKDYNIRQKKDDIEFIANKVLEKLYNKNNMSKDLKNKIIIAHKISPIDLLFYYNNGVSGVIVEDESLISHTSIIANSLDLSYMAGIKNITEFSKDEDRIIVDGLLGKIFIKPNEEFLDKYKKIQKKQFNDFELMKSNIQKESKTKDNILINVFATIDMSDNIDYLSNYPNCGVGLLRTEFIFYDRTFVPTMQEQFNNYKEIIDKLPGREITIRTFDFSRDKTPNYLKSIKQNNPAMGLRGIRFSMKNNLFESQFEALIKVSIYGNLKILIPMLSSLDEMLYVKEIEKKIIKKLNIKEKKYKLGIMLETPASIFLLEEIYKDIDFVSFGTNDLVQFFYAVDRNNTELNYLRNPMNKSFIKFLDYSVKKLIDLNLEFSICGEIILNEELILILVALGFRNFNIPVFAIPAIKNRIINMSIKESKEKLNYYI